MHKWVNKAFEGCPKYHLKDLVRQELEKAKGEVEIERNPLKMFIEFKSNNKKIQESWEKGDKFIKDDFKSNVQIFGKGD